MAKVISGGSTIRFSDLKVVAQGVQHAVMVVGCPIVARLEDLDSRNRLSHRPSVDSVKMSISQDRVFFNSLEEFYPFQTAFNKGIVARKCRLILEKTIPTFGGPSFQPTITQHKVVFRLNCAQLNLGDLQA